ncbi:NADH:ubiquinone reductase (Na(+)-transporting) subunit C [Cryomorphaceae bacterium 1068]|nr:NADH:ubiquinone reductase (Na(+)-transporting) subunit C [Cryomorphaceae bacterium 1068]
MAVDKNSNSFTFIFAFIMVVVVGAVLSFAAMSLKPLQVKNNIDKKMINILTSIGVEADRENAKELFYANITQRYILNSKGEILSTKEGEVMPTDPKDPFNVDVKKEFRDPTLSVDDRNYPLYVASIEGEEVVIIPLVGKGLWGPIWGYVALESDFNTIYGANFDHKTETPGLGAEIKESWFSNPFIGKTIYNESGELVSVDVVKGSAGPDNPHAVDGITGGTITSNGVDEMLERTFGVYDSYFKNNSQISQKQ